jgi:hypothetical protein
MLSMDVAPLLGTGVRQALRFVLTRSGAFAPKMGIALHHAVPGGDGKRRQSILGTRLCQETAVKVHMISKDRAVPEQPSNRLVQLCERGRCSSYLIGDAVDGARLRANGDSRSDEALQYHVAPHVDNGQLNDLVMGLEARRLRV